MKYLSELLNILNAMSPYLLLGFLIAGVLHVYMPKWGASRYLSQRGFKSVFLSALFGVPLPLCSCGVIPTAMSLKREGATDGATVSFLIATPQTGVDSILATYGVLGLPFAIVRPIVALVVGVVGGLFVDKFSGAKGSSEVQNSAAQECDRPTLLAALKYGFVDMVQDLGKWLIVGLVVAVLITVCVPTSVFELLQEHYILNLVVVLLFSVPMYVCSTGSIPVALSLLLMGVTPGAALVFLMAGPATNVATLMVLRRVLGVRTTVLYLLSIILGAVCFAVVVDFVLPAEWFTAKLSHLTTSAHCSDGAAWWHTASSVVFVALLINAYILKLRGVTHSHGEVEVVAPQSTTHKFKVTGMRCNHCKANVERGIAALEGVSRVEVDITNGMVEVEGVVSAEEVRKVVGQLGFEIENI